MPRAIVFDSLTGIGPPRQHGAEIAWRFTQESPPAGWTVEARRYGGGIGAAVAAALAEAEGPPRLILFGGTSAHNVEFVAAWTMARAAGCLAVVALGSNTPGSTAGPGRLPVAYVTVGADDPETPGEQTATGPGLWFEAHPFDSSDFQSWAVATAAAALARAYDAVAGLTPEPGCDRWTLALRALLASATGARVGGNPFVTWTPEAGFGLVTRDTEPGGGMPPALSPLLTVAQAGSPGRYRARFVSLGGTGTSLRIGGTEVLQTTDNEALLYLPAGASLVEALARLPGGGVTEAHAPGTVALDVATGYVPPVPALAVERVGSTLGITAEAEGASEIALSVQAGAETPTEALAPALLAWPSHRPARVEAVATGPGGQSEAVAYVPAVRSTAPMVADHLHPRLLSA